MFAKAENAIKEYELEERELHMPAINQLWYAGHHLAKAIHYFQTDKNLEFFDEQVLSAKNHCRRAYFDALDTLALESLKLIDYFYDQNMSSQHLAAELPDYADVRTRVDTIKQEVRRIRAEMYSDRTEMFERIRPLLEELSQIALKLDVVGPRVAALDQKSARDELAKQRRFWLNALLTILTILVALLGLVWQIL